MNTTRYYVWIHLPFEALAAIEVRQPFDSASCPNRPPSKVAKTNSVTAETPTPISTDTRVNWGIAVVLFIFALIVVSISILIQDQTPPAI